jgi:imidazoleglycerol-phosphate dehydratase/histidinol-phosphatase
MLTGYLDNPGYDIANSYVIGDRITDVQLAKNLGCKAIWIKHDVNLGGKEVNDSATALQAVTALETIHWEEIYRFLKLGLRHVIHERNTNETKIHIELNVDGTGRAAVSSGLGFFDHMLDQIARHGRMDLTVRVQGDLQIDEHHTIEDTGIALGEAFAMALADKRGMERYGFALPMDDADAKVLIDFGGRSWIVWNAVFMREKVGDMPTEMFFHFFKSFSDACRCNLNIECHGDNEHHKIEAIFKAFAKAIRMAVKRDPLSLQLPTTKGML